MTCDKTWIHACPQFHITINLFKFFTFKIQIVLKKHRRGLVFLLKFMHVKEVDVDPRRFRVQYLLELKVQIDLVFGASTATDI